jgi:hypothetical protein
MMKKHVYVLVCFLFFVVMGCQQEDTFLETSSELSKRSREGGKPDASANYLEYGDKLTKVLVNLIDDRNIRDGILSANMRMLDGDTESLVTDLFQEKLGGSELTGLQIFARKLAEMERISITEATNYLSTKASEMPNLIVGTRNNFTSAPTGVTAADLQIDKVVFVNGQHRNGELLFGVDRTLAPVEVRNEVFLTVQVSERHDDRGNLMINTTNPFNFTAPPPVGPLGELTPSQACEVESIPEPDGPCDTPNTPTNFTVTMEDGFIKITFNGDLEEMGTWNRYILERLNPTTGEVVTHALYSCGFTTTEYLFTDLDLIPNTTYLYRIRSVVMRKFPFGSTEDYCRSPWTNYVTVTTDASIIIDPVENYETRNFTEGVIEHFWTPPASYQSDGYKIEVSSDGTNNAWTDIADITGGLQSSYTENNPGGLGWKGHRQHYRIRNKVGNHYSLPIYDVIYPAWRSNGDGVKLQRIQIPNVGAYELPEHGFPEIFIASTIATGEDSGTKTAEALVGLLPKHGHIYFGAVLVPSGDQWVPAAFPATYTIISGSWPYELVEIANPSTISIINSWYGDYFNKVLFVNISETDTGEITPETSTEEKSIDAKGTFKIGKKDVWDVGLNIGAKKTTTVVFDYPDKTLPMGSFNIFYWEYTHRIYTLEGSNNVVKIIE